MDLRRVAVVGTSCAGKTTFAAALAAQLQVPHIELDALHWRAGWVPAPSEDFRQAVATAVAAERWVSDGNYGVVRDLVWGRATAVVWLDYPFATVLWRALYRTARRALLREQLYSGNRETFKRALLKSRFNSLVGRHHLGAASARIPGVVRAGRLRTSRGRGLRQPARGPQLFASPCRAWRCRVLKGLRDGAQPVKLAATQKAIRPEQQRLQA